MDLAGSLFELRARVAGLSGTPEGEAMSNEKTVRPPCDACGAESCASDAGYECSYEDGYYFCAKHWLESGVKNRELIAARRQLPAEPRFVDRNGVALKLGDRVRVAHGVTGVLKYFNDPSDTEGNASILRDDGITGSGTDELWLAAWQYIERIDPPADEQTQLREAVIAERNRFDRQWSRQRLIDTLLREQNHPGTFAGYDDFEAERAAREVDDGLALIDRTVANLQRVHRLRKGPNRYHTDSDCLGEK
jgi:hypothetical protein